MDDKTQRERLEQELRFLKESFEADVISKEEYEKGKDRIEKKLKEIKSLEPDAKEERKTEEAKKEDANAAVSSKEGDRIKLKVIQDEAEEHGHVHAQAEFYDAEKAEEPAQVPKEAIYEKKESNFFKYAAVFIVLALVIFFSYSLFKNKKEIEQKIPLEFVALCSSDDDCTQEGKEGFCINPAAKDAKCEFKDIPKLNVIVLNDRKSCFNCDTQRVLSILESWLGALNAKEISYSTAEGRNIAEKFGANSLPMYILEENITQKQNFEQFKRVFAKKEGYYLLNENTAGSSFYFKRESIPNRLDLFVIQDDKSSISAETNLKEFLDAFGEVKFGKHLPDDKLTLELGIKAFPTFLINNQVKFSGVQSADTIKENFCKLNKLKECEKSLSKSLV
ncbi:hypothetical protein HYX05_03240 [Candidatus Woesearchaeota archaeon]|nr:hypothetical protein [Candidatus Woesearchaeota archaeon]